MVDLIEELQENQDQNLVKNSGRSKNFDRLNRIVEDIETEAQRHDRHVKLAQEKYSQLITLEPTDCQTSQMMKTPKFASSSPINLMKSVVENDSFEEDDHSLTSLRVEAPYGYTKKNNKITIKKLDTRSKSKEKALSHIITPF